MVNYLKLFHHQKTAFSRFFASKSTKKLLEALKKQFTLDKQEGQKSDPTWNNLSKVSKNCRIDEDKTRMVSVIAQHLVDKSDSNFGMMYILNYFLDHICQIGNLFNAGSELPSRVIMDHKQLF